MDEAIEGRLCMKIEYRNFIIMEHTIKCSFGSRNWTEKNYVVYQEKDEEKYFLADVTAFDTIEEAKKCIDNLYERKSRV